MKTEEGASFLERGETNMESHRPRKRTWINQTKVDQRRKNLGEKGPMNAVHHSPCAKSAARGGAQRSLHHHRRLQRSEVDGPARIAARQVLHRLLLQKSTSPCEDSDTEKKSRKDRAPPPPPKKKKLKKALSKAVGRSYWTVKKYSSSDTVAAVRHTEQRETKTNAIGHRRDKVATTT